MPANTPRGFPYPLGTDPPAGHTQIQALAETLDTETPIGLMAYAEVTANQAGIGAAVTPLTGLTVTFTVAANRRLKITGHVIASSTVVTDLVVGKIATATFLQRFCQMAGDGGVGEGSVVHTPPAGSVTYYLTLERTTGSGTITLYAGAGFPSFILVEDLGPV